MKTLLILFTATFISTLPSAYASARVFADFSEPARAITVELSNEQKEQILNQLFGDFNHVDDYNNCSPDVPNVYVAYVANAVEGYFSHRRYTQTVASVWAVPCDSGRAGETSYLALIDNGKVVSTAKDTGTQIYLSYDEDKDGLSDLLVTSFYTGQGHSYHWGSTFTFNSQYIRKTNLHNGLVAYDNCGVSDDGREYVAVLFEKENTRTLQLFQKNYSKPCNAPNSEFRFEFNGELSDDKIPSVYN